MEDEDADAAAAEAAAATAAVYLQSMRVSLNLFQSNMVDDDISSTVPLVAGAAVVADGHHLCCSWDLNLDMSAVDPLVRVEDKRWGEVDGLSSEVVRLL